MRWALAIPSAAMPALDPSSSTRGRNESSLGGGLSGAVGADWNSIIFRPLPSNTKHFARHCNHTGARVLTFDRAQRLSELRCPIAAKSPTRPLLCITPTPRYRRQREVSGKPNRAPSLTRSRMHRSGIETRTARNNHEKSGGGEGGLMIDIEHFIWSKHTRVSTSNHDVWPQIPRCNSWRYHA